MENAMVAVNFDDILEAFEFVSFGEPLEHEAFLDRTTGRVFWVSEGSEDEVPEDLEENPDRYLAIPHKNDLDLGSALVFQFAADTLPGDYGKIEGFFHKRGAYARFKDFLAEKGRLEEWYAFEAARTEKALREWCADNGVTLVAEGGPDRGRVD
jgi:hypothetical protein